MVILNDSPSATFWSFKTRLAIVVGALLATLGAPAWATPSAIGVDGALLNAGGGPATDGVFEFNVAFYANDTGGVAGWQEKGLLAAVKGGAFRLTLGLSKPLNGKLLADHPFIGIGIVGEPELPRRPLYSVPFALRAAGAEGLDCSGCLGAAQFDAKFLASLATQGDLAAYAPKATLAPLAQSGAYADLQGAPDLSVYAKTSSLTDVAKTGQYGDLVGLPVLAKVGTACGTGLFVAGIAADGSLQCAAPLGCKGCVGLPQLATEVTQAFVGAKGGTVDGKLAVTAELALGDAKISGGHFAAVDIAKAPCGAANLGQLAIHTGNQRLYFCDSSAWQRLSVCKESCPPAATVACGDPIANTCGDVGGCAGTGSACPNSQTCVNKKCLGPGGSAETPALSCADALKADPTLKSGTLWIDPNGGATTDSYQVACEQTIDNGGWTSVASFASAGPDSWSFYSANWTNDATFGDNDFALTGGAAIDRKFKSWGTVGFSSVLFVSQDGTKYHVMHNFKGSNLTFASAKALFASGGNWLWANKKVSAGGGMWDYPNWAFNNVETVSDQCWNARVNVCKQTYVGHTGGGSLIGTACNGGTGQNADLAKDSIGTTVYNCVSGGNEPHDLPIAADAYYAMFVR